jgi:hypothetical protein
MDQWIDRRIKWIMKVRKIGVRFGVSMAMGVKIMVFWVVTPCSLLDKYYCDAVGRFLQNTGTQCQTI